jgi:hypothetical protein
MLVAGIAGASPAELWEISDAGERENVAVDLSMAPRPAVPPPVPPPVAPPAKS